MVDEFINFGVPVATESDLRLEVAAKTIAVVRSHPDVDVIECRVLGEGETKSEIVVVECRCDGVPSRNRIGIQYRERLGLRFFANTSNPPEVRALRADFPCTAHQNHVGKNEPASLCLYFESWSEVRRTWTPQRHLDRIQWWLSETANETLHQADQPVEPIYFRSRFELVLPREFEREVDQTGRVMVVEARAAEDEKESAVLVGRFVSAIEALEDRGAPIQCIALTLPAVLHGRIERIPTSLGDLHDQIASRGAPIDEALKQKLQALAGETGLSPAASDFSLLVMAIPVKREGQATAEDTQTKGFVLNTGLGELGVKLGALMPLHEGKHYCEQHIGGSVPVEPTAWRDIVVEPLELLHPFSSGVARQSSGITSTGPIGVLAGAGAVGSALASIWQREGWGSWQYIDPDILKPHNLARHIGFEFQIGQRKIDVVQQLGEHILPAFSSEGPSVYGSASDFCNPAVCKALDSSQLVIDATTTLEVPRELAGREALSRCASVFVTPSGRDAVLLMEDAGRTTRLDCLEAQYYRAVINADWGGAHLRGAGSLWVGAGCRQLSTVMSNEVVLLHSATLAKQVRLRYLEENPTIRVWQSDEESGGLSVAVVEAKGMLVESIEGLRIVWDEGVRGKVRAFRAERLPNETGGVVLGYFDLTRSSVYVVDVVPQPQDSEGDITGFTRGVEGLTEVVQMASDRTAGIVNYVGEWHSHPHGSSAQPSSADIYQMVHLANELRRDGLPALMLIVGEHDEQWLAGAALP